jgi:alkylation response protein AidB-like acyl-CoA dehydrogenase
VARQYALDRNQFGRPLCEFQGLQWKFSEMAVKLEAAQMLLYRAASVANGELPSAYDTAVAKLACNQAGFEVANEALQVMGGYGYSTESLVEYCVKRTRGWMIAGGLDRNAQEPDRRTRLRAAVRPACTLGGRLHDFEFRCAAQARNPFL